MARLQTGIYCWLSISLASAAALPAGIFQDHMVLQRDRPVPVWGTALPGEHVTVRFAGRTQTAVSDAHGKWMVRLPAMRASAKPADLKVNDVTVKDVLVGDVWLAAGQSNMEMGIGVCDVPDDIARAEFPGIRLFTVPREIADRPRESFAANDAWKRCSPESLVEGGWGGFSAAGFFFGRMLHERLRIPIGIISVNWGGTAAESWTSVEAMQAVPVLRPALEKSLARIESARENAAANAAARQAWWRAKDSAAAQWADPSFDDTAWKPVTLPAEFSQMGLRQFEGIVWFRRGFEVPAGWAGKDLELSLGPIDDCDITYINGEQVGEGLHRFLDRHYRVPASLLRTGHNVIAIRTLSVGGFGGVYGLPRQLTLKPAEDAGANVVSLAGQWRYQLGAPLAGLKPLPPGMPREPFESGTLYNAMVAPLTPLAIRGAIWYQGEGNASRAGQYRVLLATMIQDWRIRFGQPGFPFLIVQLANYSKPMPQPGESNWAELREAQSQVAETVPNTGMAVAIDIGDPEDIHPKNKKEVGRRLALVALAKVYGKRLEYSGPMFQSMSVEGSAIRVRFSHSAGGLVAKDGPLRQFAIAGSDGKFVWADARIERGTVVVSSSHVAHPVTVRYGWAHNPEGANLYNKAGMPAGPFRASIGGGKIGADAASYALKIAGNEKIVSTARLPVRVLLDLHSECAGTWTAGVAQRNNTNLKWHGNQVFVRRPTLKLTSMVPMRRNTRQG